MGMNIPKPPMPPAPPYPEKPRSRAPAMKPARRRKLKRLDGNAYKKWDKVLRNKLSNTQLEGMQGQGKTAADQLGRLRKKAARLRATKQRHNIKGN